MNMVKARDLRTLLISEALPLSSETAPPRRPRSLASPTQQLVPGVASS